jgi:hypothetical protein
MSSNQDNKQRLDQSNPYEVLETSNNISSGIFKDIPIEEPIYQMNLQIEKEKIINKDCLITSKLENQRLGHIGKLRVFKYNSDGDPKIVIGPHWPFYFCLTTVLFLLIFLFFYFLWNYLDLSIKLLGILIYILQFSSYTYVFLINPGIPKNFLKLQAINPGDKLEKGFKFCNKCKIVICVSAKVNHCTDCDVCVEGNHKKY